MKKYITPQIKVVKIQPALFLASSDDLTTIHVNEPNDEVDAGDSL